MLSDWDRFKLDFMILFVRLGRTFTKVMSGLSCVVKRVFGNFRIRYIPLLMVYFSYGATGLTSIAETFWVKKHLDISAEALIAIGFWVGIPWTVKMVFGQFADSIRIFGSGRKIYIFVGAGLVAIGYLIMVGLAAGSLWLLRFGDAGGLFLFASLLWVIGFVLQDVIADAMSTEVVSRRNQDGTPRLQEDVDGELAQIQWLGRIALMGAGVLVAGIGGWVAPIVGYKNMFALALVIPLLSVIGAIFVKLNEVPKTPVNWWILGGGLIYGGFVAGIWYFGVLFGQEIVFFVSLLIIVFMISKIGISRSVAVAAFVLFIFRAMPGPGPGVGWWAIDVLRFDETFQGTLAQTGTILSLAGLFFFRKYIIEKPIGFTLAWLTVVGSVLYLPNIGLFYGAHKWFGVSAKTFAFVDTTLSAPLAQLSMVPLLTLVAKTCPEGKAATWFSLMASLMNLALIAGNLGTRYLNKIYIVTREVKSSAGIITGQANYDNVGTLMIISWVVGLLVPMTAIWFCFRDEFGKKSAS